MVLYRYQNKERQNLAVRVARRASDSWTDGCSLFVRDVSSKGWCVRTLGNALAPAYRYESFVRFA